MAFVPWTPTFHQAAITGKVMDAVTSRPVPGVKVEIAVMPAAFQQWLSLRALQFGSTWGALAERPDRTQTDADGGFRFLDLPDGSYTLSFSIPGPGAARRYGSATQIFTVQRDAQGKIPPSIGAVSLPPTGVKGLVHATVQGQPTPLPMAHVRVQGSGELGFTDELGQFYLTDVEPGSRALDISAPGNDTLTTTASITEGQVGDLGVLLLIASP
jgi:Carboxypeptidase regulatory-like domain